MSIIPNHIGIILDGNRRFAKKLNLNPWKGHEYGSKKLKDLLVWCRELKIKELTLYCFSMQNFNRPKKEFDYLMKIFDESFKELMENKDIDKYKIKINFIGRYNLFSDYINDEIHKIMDKTKNYDNYKINIALAYGGREEIVDAVKRIAEKIKENKLNPEEINEKIILENLDLGSEPDLIIRTGGDKRTSNFLTWQSIYSEWFFIEKMWPEFEKQDLIDVIEEYKKRERRFGK
ncbi:MAG: polyprenyl diphosphate synthase [Candidatus Nanoarchaeia archaeon]|nr:polyprenyl diphosphate synthase [Candidatus Nanoarchaeia archaeon]